MRTLARERDTIEILRRLKTITPASRRRWGRMSVHQMICHLNDSFLAVTGRRRASMATGPFQRTIMKWTALYLPVRWPPDIPTRPEIDQTVGGTAPIDFVTDIAQLETLFQLVTTDIGCFDGQQHPIFGPM